MDYRDAVIFTARVLLMILFIMTGWQKLREFSGTVAYMRTTGTPWPQLSAVVAIIVEFLFGIGIALGVDTGTRDRVRCVHAGHGVSGTPSLAP